MGFVFLRPGPFSNSWAPNPLFFPGGTFFFLLGRGALSFGANSFPIFWASWFLRVVPHLPRVFKTPGASTHFSLDNYPGFFPPCFVLTHFFLLWRLGLFISHTTFAFSLQREIGGSPRAHIFSVLKQFSRSLGEQTFFPRGLSKQLVATTRRVKNSRGSQERHSSPSTRGRFFGPLTTKLGGVQLPKGRTGCTNPCNLRGSSL